MQNNICNPDHTVKYAFDEPCFSQIRVYSTQIRARICWSGIVNTRRDHNLARWENEAVFAAAGINRLIGSVEERRTGRTSIERISGSARSTAFAPRMCSPRPSGLSATAGRIYRPWCGACKRWRASASMKCASFCVPASPKA